MCTVFHGDYKMSSENAVDYVNELYMSKKDISNYSTKLDRITGHHYGLDSVFHPCLYLYSFPIPLRVELVTQIKPWSRV